MWWIKGFLKSILYMVVLLILFWLFMGMLAGSGHKGEEKGAYKQLRGEYEITYEVNSQGFVTDTIIHIK